MIRYNDKNDIIERNITNNDSFKKDKLNLRKF